MAFARSKTVDAASPVLKSSSIAALKSESALSAAAESARDASETSAPSFSESSRSRATTSESRAIFVSASSSRSSEKSSGLR